MGSATQISLFDSTEAKLLVGVDEVGRGCIAGPVVACACFALEGCELPKVYDSKVLTKEDREDLFFILSQLPGFHFAFGVISSGRIDQINILQATFEAMKLALERLPQQYDKVLVDGSMTIPGLNKNQEAIIKGDAKEPLISAASIMAKVYRDHLMSLIAKDFPDYGFDIHKGYGTAMHLEAIEKHGATIHHRLSFAPFSKKQQSDGLQLELEDFFI
jgi:ribonuclease HII